MEIEYRRRSRELITSQDVIFEMLLRLPAKSLMRFKLICKQWHSIISDDLKFEELHSKTCIQIVRLLFHIRPSLKILGSPVRPTNDFWIYKPQENTKELQILHRFPFTNVKRCPKPVCSSGTVLFYRVEENNLNVTYVVYDWINNNEIVLPDLSKNVSFRRNVFLVYDSSTDMHKMLVYTEVPTHVSPTDLCFTTSFNTKTLATENGWRMQLSPSKTQHFPMGLRKVAIKGILYWLAYEVKEHLKLRIQSFDIAEEKFLNPIRCPENKIQSMYPEYRNHLLKLRGSLGFMLLTGIELKVWVLKDSDNSSWIQLHKIFVRSILDSPIRYNCALEPVFVLEKLKGVPSIILRYKNRPFLYEMNGEKMKEMGVKWLSIYRHCLAAWFS